MELTNNTVNNLTSAIAALIEALGMQAENEWRKSRGEAIAYTEDSFRKLFIDHNITGF